MKCRLNIIIIFTIIFVANNISLFADYILKKGNFILHYNENKILYRIDEDRNHDGKIDIKKFLKDKKVYKIEEDNNFDGFFETTIFLKNNLISKIEIDKNKDGRPDIITFYKKNKIFQRKIDKNYDGKFEIIEYFKNNKIIKKITPNEKIKFLNKTTIITKKNGDMLIYKNNILRKAIIDKGKKILIYNKKGKLIEERIDENRDGFFEKIIKNNEEYFYKKNCKKPFKIESKNLILYDKNCNGIFEKKIVFQKEHEFLYKDTDENRIYEKLWIFNGKNLIEFKEDKNQDGKFDYYVEYKNKKISEIKIDRNFDGRIDEWKFYKNGKLVKTEIDLNFDGKIDIEE